MKNVKCLVIRRNQRQEIEQQLVKTFQIVCVGADVQTPSLQNFGDPINASLGSRYQPRQLSFSSKVVGSP